MERVLMKCGCVAQGVLTGSGGVKFDPPIPGCVIHSCYEPADSRPDLTGRTAQCAYSPKGHAPKPSSYDLAFFEFLGEGSREATELCKCGYSKSAHKRDNGYRTPKSCKGFTPKGAAEFDRYYCGCHGWD